MKKWLVAVLFGTVLVLSACGGGDDSADDAGTDTGSEDGGTAVESAGEDIFKANCSACHGADLSGGAGPDLTTIGSKYSADELADIITNGIGSMPAQNVTGEDLDTLSNWLAEKK